MSEIRNIELEDSKGNRYYFHTDASIVKYKDTTVEEQLDKITQSLIDSAITNDDLITPSLIEGFELINGYYVKTNENFVYVNLNFKGTFANSTWVKFFDLPVGYRPSKEKMINGGKTLFRIGRR